MSTNYKSLFEGKFTQRVGLLPSNIIHKLYYNFSPTTYTERVLNKFIISSLIESKKLDEFPATPKIIDMGCGGGNEVLANAGCVTGVDISASSIENAQDIYHEAKALDITAGLPYDDGVFDIGFSSEVFGHISNNDKEKFLKEMNRVLHKDAYVVISSETYGSNWYTNYLKVKGLYEECWIEPWGHIGLISMEDTTELISKYFNIKKFSVTSTWCFSLDNLAPALRYNKLFKFIVDSTVLRRLFNFLMYPLYRLSIVFYMYKSVNDVVYLAQKKNTVSN